MEKRSRLAKRKRKFNFSLSKVASSSVPGQVRPQLDGVGGCDEDVGVAVRVDVHEGVGVGELEGGRRFAAAKIREDRLTRAARAVKSGTIECFIQKLTKM